MARYRTLWVWPIKVATLFNLGYDQILISFWEYPWVLTSSCIFLLNAKLQIWEPVSFYATIWPVRTFLNLRVLSAVPPPVARRPCCWGDQAKALTAALWSVYLLINWPVFDHTPTLLSFPPDARYCSSRDHFRPHIYWLCSSNFAVKSLLIRVSLKRMLLSLDPVESWEELQAKAPTLLSWPPKALLSLPSSTSQSWTYPLLHPTASVRLSWDHPTEVTRSFWSSQSLVTFDVSAFQRYIQWPSPTASWLFPLQSIKFR